MAKSYTFKSTRAILTKPAVINGGRYPAGTKFTIGEPLDKGRHRITFHLKRVGVLFSPRSTTSRTVC